MGGLALLFSGSGLWWGFSIISEDVTLGVITWSAYSAGVSSGLVMVSSAALAAFLRSFRR